MPFRALVLALCATVWVLTPTAGVAAEPVVSTQPPVVEGSAVVGEVLRSGRGAWEPSEVTVTFQWLRDGTPVPGATDRGYRVAPDDLHHRLSVRATATGADGGTGTATSEPTEPVVRGEWLQAGTHLDLVGGFTPTMRESDDDAVARARVYVDTRAGATREAGDIVQPLASGLLKPDAIVADLHELARGQK